MLRLKELTLARFRSFVEPQTLKFPARGLTMVRSNGSGTGKSSLFMAIADAVDACPVPATQLQSNGATEPRSVNVTWAVDGGSTFTVKRSSNLSLVVDGQDVKGVAARLWERVTELMGLRRLEWIVPLTYRPQKCRSFFLTLSDAEKKEFLSGVLGLDHVEDELAKSDDAVSGLKARFQAAEKAQTEAETALKLAEETLAAAELVEEQPLVADVASAEGSVKFFLKKEKELLEKTPQPVDFPFTAEEQAEIDRLGQRPPASPLVAEFEKRLLAVDQAMAAEMAAWTEAMKAHRAACDENSKLQGQRLQHGFRLNELRKRQLVLEAQTAAMNEHGKCPTCHQAWSAGESHFEQLEEELEGVMNEAQDLQNWLDDPRNTIRMNPDAPAAPDQSEDLRMKKELRRRLDRLHNDQVQKAGEQAAQLSAIHDARKAKVEAARWAHRQELEKVRGLIADRRLLLEQAKGRLQAGQLANARYITAQNGVKNRLAALQSAQFQLDKAQKELNLELDFQALVGAKGFLGSIFDEILQEISNKTNELLAKLPNVSHISMTLVSSKTAATTKKQTKAITPTFRDRGHVVEKGWDVYFSGGQVTAIELAIDLAVAQVIGQRTGIMPGWLILDEPFVGLPAAEVEQVLEVLQVLAQDRLVMVIDHLPDAQQWFPNFIDLRMENGQTKVLDTAG